MKLIELIAANLRALENVTKLNETQFAEKCKVHQRTYNRIVNMETMPKLDILEKIADANDLEVWQLLVDGLDVSNPPMLERDSEKQREFYKHIKMAAQELAKYGK